MKLAEPEFLTLAEVLYLHDESVARYGGLAGILQPGLLNLPWERHRIPFGTAMAIYLRLQPHTHFTWPNHRLLRTEINGQPLRQPSSFEGKMGFDFRKMTAPFTMQ